MTCACVSHAITTSVDPLMCSDKEVEVAAAIGLQYVRGVELRVAAVGHDGRTPRGTPSLEFRIVDEQIEASSGGIETDAIAVTHEGERTAGRGFR